MDWRIEINGCPVCDMGLESASLALRVGGPDELTLQYSGGTSAPMTQWQTVSVARVRRDTDGEILANDPLYVGRVYLVERTGEDGAHGWAVTARNGWADLAKCPYTQAWGSRGAAAESSSPVRTARCLLYQADDGSAIDTGATARDIVQRAAAQGAVVSVGVVDIDMTVPPAEIVDSMCDAALQQTLSYHPDAVAYIDGSGALHVRRPASLPTVTVDPCRHGLATTQSAREAEAPSGVVIIWERAHTQDDGTYVERIEQRAGSPTGWPPPIYMTIPLAGMSGTARETRIQTRTLPVPGQHSATFAKNFFRGAIPQLSAADNDDIAISAYKLALADSHLDELVDDTVNPNSRPATSGNIDLSRYPRMLVGGAIESWMPPSIRAYDARLTATLHYRGSDRGIRDLFPAGKMQIDAPIKITNALPKTYRDTDAVGMAAQPIPGLATAYFAALSGVANQGSINGHYSGATVDLRPGRRVVIAGEFATPAIITSSTIDLLDETFSATYGGSEYLSPKTIADVARCAQRNRPSWQPAEARKDGAAIGLASPISTGDEGAPKHLQPLSASVSRLWDVIIDTSAPGGPTVRIINAGQLRLTADVDDSGLIAIDGLSTTWSLADGDYLLIDVSLDGGDVVAEIAQQSTWTNYPWPWATVADQYGFHEMSHAYYPLYKCIPMPGTLDPIRHVAMTEQLCLYRMAANVDLALEDRLEEMPDGQMIQVVGYVPTHAVI